ncbi:MAG TPA: NFACT RNA binding domain-containing protein [Limnochordia bacterium]|nr:NFACT RNA binding domain-containing protein [Limnochordia bacterium]
MSYDGIVFRALALELDAQLRNARIRRVHQPAAHEIRLACHRPGSEPVLLVSVDPSRPRVHLSEARAENPLKAPNFCMLLRKHLVPGRILGVRQIAMERILVIEVEATSELGARVVRELHIELMGRHSNLLLIDPDTATILDGLRRVGADLSRRREVAPGAPYIPPPPQQKRDPLAEGAAEFAFALRHTPSDQPLSARLLELYEGFGKLAARELLVRAGFDPEARRDALDAGGGERLWRAFAELMGYVREGRFAPAVCVDKAGVPQAFWAFPPAQFTLTVQRCAGMSAALAAYFEPRLALERVDQLRRRLLAVTERALEKVRKKAELQRAALAQSEAAAHLRKCGELLLAFAHQIPAGAESALVSDYYDPAGATLAIPLDPEQTPAENAQGYFRRYEKAKRTQAALGEEYARTEAERNYLEAVESALELADDEPALHEIEAELTDGGYLADPKRAAKSKEPVISRPRRYIALDGTTLLVGRNNRQNDQLTLRTADERDLWLHTKEIPGSHVVIRSGGREVAPETLELGALLAARYSKARAGSNVPVDYCERRYVRKPRGAKPGMVIYDHQKTLYVTPDDARTAELVRA